MKRNLKAFTLAEILVVMCVLATIITLTAVSTLTADSTKEKKLVSISQTFYSNIENTYQQILLSDTSNGSIVNIKDENGDGSTDSTDLKDLFAKYMDGQEISCSKLANNTSVISDYLTDAACAIFSPNIIAGFYLDTSCSLEIYAKEYFTENHDSKTVQNACGRIIYGSKDSKGKFTYDLFTIALGKRSIK